ncbi:MAG: hypothetical protein GTO45_39840 [Candidatus Aminicenantes bacterium]|nr:hypothetical protein [Candidatus Aminicenantes bacterium]NIM83299.1 hypothetical protein [Candidatus Aminicenantes bacterium]NIN24271.1 hypothetical protein [Candidatus Aminicenantes bacterium]NIN48032.1 hypothetical protein [Candidatus Aminicenantes bacterium]NIN90934.1 hypothetical protein [Candidatus Aminicenantes bacterium]
MTMTQDCSSAENQLPTQEIATIDHLAQSLALHTQFISDNIIRAVLREI